jgi:8-oxo-dGTP pyrophosphatase MutT (NUDIX family)
LVKPTYKETWDIPGGYVEPGESPRDACVREVAEELGIKPAIGDLLVIDWAPQPSDGDKILFVFDGGTLTPEDYARIRVDGTEVETYELFDLQRASTVLNERLTKRLTAAAAAHQRGQTAYLEYGKAS